VASRYQSYAHLLFLLLLLPSYRSIGYYDQADKLMADLSRLIEAHESAVGREYEARLSAQHAARAALDELLRRQDTQDVASPNGNGNGNGAAQLGQSQQPPHGEEVQQQNESTKRD
jgi:hypothetical protein